MNNEMVRAGYHQTAKEKIESDFSKAEKKIAEFWAQEWYITSAGKRTTLGRSDFKFFLAKPVRHVEEALNISREIILYYSRKYQSSGNPRKDTKKENMMLSPKR